MNDNKTNINCLSCIYGDYHLKTYKIGGKIEILQVLIK